MKKNMHDPADEGLIKECIIFSAQDPAMYSTDSHSLDFTYARSNLIYLLIISIIKLPYAVIRLNVSLGYHLILN